MSFNTFANNRNDFTNTILKLRFEQMEANKGLKRAFILFLIVFGMWLNDWFYNIWLRMIFIIFATYFLINVVNSSLILIQLLFKKPLYGTQRQRELLNLAETTNLIQSFPKVYTKTKENNLPESGFTALQRQHRHLVLASTPKKGQAQMSPKKALKRKLKSEDFIADEQSFRVYLEEFENAQQMKDLDYTTSHVIKNPSSVQAHAVKLLKTSVYQLAADNKQQSPPHVTNYTNNLQTEILAHISSEQLSQYVLNLRHWISITILKPLINEIDDINAIFERLPLHEFRIGVTGLEHLRNLVTQTEFIMEYARRLPMIMPYLEICTNQIYLLERLRSLANGAWLDNYTCRMISTMNFKNLPNDPSIIFQCLCNYFDRQLLSLTPDGAMHQRIFYDNYIILYGGQDPVKQLHTLVRNHAGCAIICMDLIRPKFNLITNDKLYYGQYYFNNLFHVFLGFVTYLKRHNNGMLEDISLGSNGINILRVIGETD